jgi:hypothetical protein
MGLPVVAASRSEVYSMTGSGAASISFSVTRLGPARKHSKRRRVNNLDSANIPNPYVSYCYRVVDVQGWLTCSSRKHTAEPGCAGKRPLLAKPVHNSRPVKQRLESTASWHPKLNMLPCFQPRM